jgi:GTP-binding protein Era
MTHKFGFAALAGPPNAGKSTLMNRLVGQKVAIVSPKPQTTRNRITGILTREDCQVVFLDTPGVHRRPGRMNRFLLESAQAALSSADVVTVLVDGQAWARNPDAARSELAPLAKSVSRLAQPLLVGVNKADLLKEKARLLPVLQDLSTLWPQAEIIPLSALTGEGADTLLERIVSHLPAGEPMFPEDQVSTVPLRFMAAEIVREKLFLSLSQELPYSTAVEIEAWEEEPDKGLTRVAAVIHTGRDSHKAMIIGKGGAMLKKVGTMARLELEELLESRVDLKLWVKVRPNWTEDPGFMRSIGLGE